VVRCDELREQIDGVWVHIRGKLDLPSQNVLVYLDRGATVPERGEPAQHFKDENSQRPPLLMLATSLKSGAETEAYQSTDLLYPLDETTSGAR
jgi:hypothetical protein